MTHSEVIDVGVKWLKRFGCSLIVSEGVSLADESPDILAYKHASSILLEAKVSRSDFLADKKKYFRRRPECGMGSYRFYICPEGLILKEDLPTGWGLIYAVNGKAKVIVGPLGNSMGFAALDGDIEMFKANHSAENVFLLAAIRKMTKRESKNCNYKIYAASAQEKESD